MSLLWLLAAMIPTGAAESRGFFLDGHRDTLAINETAGKVAILVRRCCGADLPPATVEFVTIPGSAEEGADYKGVQTNLVFSAGQTERVVEITLLNDSLIEFSETFTAFLQNPGAGSSLDPQHSLRVEIFDEDQGYLIPYSTLIADQNSRALEVIVNRFGGPSLSASTVDFFTTDGTAVSGRDYVATQRTLAFAPGETEKTVYIPILDDGMPRPWIDFTVSLRNPTGDTPLGWSTSSRVYIDGRNQGFKFRSTVPMQLQESEPYAVIEVMRGGSLLPEATVELFTANGTAWAGLDYSEVKTNLLFAAGQTSQFVWIPLRNDALTEDAETFKVQLRQASGFPLHYSDLALSVQIQDNDQGFVVRPTAPDYGRVQEDQALMHFEVALLGDFDATHAAAVTVATRDDKMAGAVAGQDYQAFEARLVFAPGERVKSFSIAILNDTLIEGLEGFPLYLSEPEGAPLSRYQAWTIGTIMDNESGYRFNEAEEAQDLVFHEGRKASVTIQRNGEFNFNSSVTLKLTSTSALFAEVGSATAGVDFPLTNVLVEFGPGQSRKAVTFDLPDDGVNELEETLYLELEADGDAVPKAHRATRAHILDVGVLPVLVDPEFDTSNPILPSHNNRSAVALADGKIIYAIDRRGYDGNPGSVIQRALPDGRPDPAWIPAVTPSSVTALAPIPTGGVFVGLADGIFSGSQNQWVLRLHSDGTIDRSFNPSTSVLRTISSLTVDAEGRLVAVGSGLATRFLADGRRDPSFRSVFQWLSLEGAQLDHAGNILLRGERTLIRLTPDGLVDRTFHAYFREEGDFVPNYVDTILPLTDGSLLVDGHEGVEQKHVVRRLLADGSLDRDFLPISAGTIRLMSVGDGTVWLVRSSSNEQLMGWFLERLLPDGTRDPSFPSQQIRFTSRYQYPPLLFASLPQGQIMALNPALIEGQPRHGAAKLHPLATNRVVVAAESARISEMAGLATVRLIRGGPATNGLVLDWITEPVSAVPGVDYTFSQGRVNFPAGSHEAEVQVPVLDNNLPDRDRFVQLRFNGGSDATPPPTGFSIANDDPGFPADGIVVLTEGGVLLRPTGWLGSETHYTRVEAGSLGSFQEWFQLSEPFPEMVALGLAVYPNPLFFRVRSIPLSSP